MAKTPAQRTLDDLLELSIAPLLRQRGFRKASRTWRRSSGSCVQVVEVQVDRASTADVLQFRVAPGIFFGEVMAVQTYLGWQPGPAGPKEGECHLSWMWDRAGSDYQPLRAGTELGEPSQWLCNLMLSRVFPWFERLSDIQSARALGAAFMGPSGPIAFAVAAGDTETARRLLEESVRSSPQATAIHAWGRSLGLISEH